MGRTLISQPTPGDSGTGRDKLIDGIERYRYALRDRRIQKGRCRKKSVGPRVPAYSRKCKTRNKIYTNRKIVIIVSDETE